MPLQQGDTAKILACVVDQILQENGWKIGYYIFQKHGLKKPKKKELQEFYEKMKTPTNTNTNDNLEIELKNKENKENKEHSIKKNVKEFDINKLSYKELELLYYRNSYDTMLYTELSYNPKNCLMLSEID